MEAIQRNEKEQIQVARKEYKEKKYIDVRIFYIDETTGTYLPSKKGITCSEAVLPKLITALQNL